MNVSRRNFSFSIAGLFGALFLPKKTEATSQVISASENTFVVEYYKERIGTRLSGKLHTNPTCKSYLKEDGSFEDHTFFLMDVGGDILPVAGWGAIARHLNCGLQPGTPLKVAGAINSWKTPEGKLSSYLKLHEVEILPG